MPIDIERGPDGMLWLLEFARFTPGASCFSGSGFHPGARLRATLPDGRTLVRELYAGSSYLASEDPRLHLGLGAARSLPILEVRWPDGRTLCLRDVPANRVLVLHPPATS